MQIEYGRRIICAVGAIVVFLVLAGCSKSQGVGGPPPGPPEVSVVVVQAQRVPIVTELPGRTSAYLIAEVRPQVGGIVKKRLFSEGADVKAGDVLYQIDPAMYEAAYASAAAGLARAEANVTSIRAKVERYKELVDDRRGQPAGLRRRGSGPQAGRGRYRGEQGRRGDGPHQPGIYPRHRAHYRAHRQIERDRGRPCHSEPGHPLHDDPAARPDLRGRDPVERQPAAAAAQHGSRAGSRTAVPAGRG